MTDTTIADRTHISVHDVDGLITAFGLGGVLGRHHLAEGLMNVNWQLDTVVGSFALKRVMDVPLDRLRRNLAVLPALGAEGIPVPTPVTTASGDAIAEVGGEAYCLFPWAVGEHMRGIDLPLPRVSALGAHLARLHRALGAVADSGQLPPVPERGRADVTAPEQAVQKADRHTAAVLARSAGDAFDAVAKVALERRRALLAERSHLRPQSAVPVGPHGWTHGDFQYRNLLWADGELAAVLDWDRLGVRPYAEEVVRTAQVQFGVEGVFDLERVSAFVAGYRSVIPLESADLADAARRLWWKRMTDFWQLEFHYDRGDCSFDELFIADEALLHWWTERLDVVERAFAGSA